MSGYWIISIVVSVIFITFLITRIACSKKYYSTDNLIIATEIISFVSGVIMMIFIFLSITFPIDAKVQYENVQKRIEYAESLSCETETEKFKHDYILAEAEQWRIDVRYNIDKYGIFSQYYTIEDLTR